MKKLFVLPLFLLLFTFGCDDESSSNNTNNNSSICTDSCTEIPNKTICVEDDSATGFHCECELNFTEDATGNCIAVTGPCDSNPCIEANKTTCVENGTTYNCECDTNYTEDASGDCIVADPCVPNLCTDTNKTICVQDGTSYYCECDTNYTEDATGDCIVDSICAPNPCTDLNKSVCVEDATDAYHCDCDDGFVEDATGDCIVDPTACAFSFTCMGDYCVDPTEVFQCAIDTDCGNIALTCTSTNPIGTCVGCAGGAACPVGFECFTAGSGYCLKACDNGNPCPDAMSCNTGYCGAKSCTLETDCPDGYGCEGSGSKTCQRVACPL
jgi:hypothetical protein